ncbi:MAG: M48 family metalloprotease [Calditrichaeota bacterium]|nr:M48 family metalloprotease [Calditrichota bacterium]
MKGTIRIKKLLAITKNVVFFFLLASCAVNPVTGKRELSLLTESQEIKLGAESDPAIVAQFGLYDDPKISKFLDNMGQKMAKVSHRPTLQFYFRVLGSPVINAFALPGGYVYFTRGILAYMNSEAEVAGVLGHEIGHVTARHGAKAYTRAQLAQVGLTAGSIFSKTFRQFGDLAAQSIGLLFLKFGRDQERQSDQLGVEYSTKIGYDAGNMSHFFGTLKRLSSESGQSLPSWASTHPAPEKREAKTLKLARAEQQKYPGQTFSTNRDAYLNLIDGLVFGADPRQGFVENGTFYHPELEFQFPVPSGWKILNTPAAVQMGEPEQKAVMQFTLGKEPSARSAADKFVTQAEGTLNYSRFKKVHGFTAEIRQVTISTEQGAIDALAYFIEKDKNIYVFLGFSKKTDFSRYEPTFKHTMEGFDHLRNQAAKNVKPTRVKVVGVTGNTTLDQFLKKYPSKEFPPDELAILNGMELTDALKRGDRIKVLTK